MSGISSSISDPFAIRAHFPLQEVTGRWVSPCGSPRVHIVFKGRSYRLEFSYDADTVFICPIFQKWGVNYFYLYGRIKITYDAGRDILVLSDYGEYIRSDEE